METVIEIDNLSKEYEKGFLKKKRTLALDSLTLSVVGGQIFGFLGGNGAGKTTTIKTLMRLQFPTGGTARIFGRDISDVEMHRRIGYCPESPYFYDYLTPVELMAHFGRLFGMSPAAIRTRTDELLTVVGLETTAWKRQLRKFSKGMLQRVGLAQSLINDPELVFLDEPMSGLDPVGRREIRELIAALRDKGVSIFMSTHILSDIEALCDEVAILRRGKLAANGRLGDLLASTEGQRSFHVSLQGVKSIDIADEVELVAGASIAPAPDGAVVTILEEADLDAILRIARTAGGRLVSVEPVKQSLEDLF